MIGDRNSIRNIRGKIGYETLARVVCHPALRELPFYLETPNELDGYAKEIHMMREAWEKG